MNLQDKERIIEAFDDAISYEENFRPWKDGEAYFKAIYEQEPVYKTKTISLFGQNNLTLRIRQKPGAEVKNLGQELAEYYEKAGQEDTGHEELKIEFP